MTLTLVKLSFVVLALALFVWSVLFLFGIVAEFASVFIALVIMLILGFVWEWLSPAAGRK